MDKVILLIDGFDKKIVKSLEKYNPLVVKSNFCNSNIEISFIQHLIEEFSKKSKHFLVVVFSGDEYVYNEIGDICSELIISLSNNTNSPRYIGCNSLDEIIKKLIYV